MQSQDDDGLYYVVVTRVRIKGIPLGALQSAPLALSFLNSALANCAMVEALERYDALPISLSMIERLKESAKAESAVVSEGRAWTGASAWASMEVEALRNDRTLHPIERQELTARVSEMALRHRQGVAEVVWLRLHRQLVASPCAAVSDGSDDEDWFYQPS